MLRLNYEYFSAAHLHHLTVRSMKLISVHIPDTYIKALDRLVELRLYPSRAEAIRFAIRDLILREAPIGENYLEEVSNGAAGEPRF